MMNKYTKDKNKYIKIRVSEQEFNEFNDFAKSQNLTLSETIRKVMKGSISRHKKY